MPEDYPHELTEQAFLDDGMPIAFRAMRPDDDQRLNRLFYRLSPESLYLRFFTPTPRPNAAAMKRLVNVDYVDRLALVALIDDEIVGVARYDRLAASAPPALRVDPGEAEAAVIVEDAWQGHGIATRLLWRLTAAAVDRGIDAFTGTILASNSTMIGLLSVLGRSVEMKLSGTEYLVNLRLAGVTAPRAAPDAPDASGHQ